MQGCVWLAEEKRSGRPEAIDLRLSDTAHGGGTDEMYIRLPEQSGGGKVASECQTRSSAV
jgi:hypothetical protein